MQCLPVSANCSISLALKTEIPDLLCVSLTFHPSRELSFTHSYQSNRKDCRSKGINCVESLNGIR